MFHLLDNLLKYLPTGIEWIAIVARWACADGRVVDYFADCIGRTRSRAWVDASLIVARFVKRTFTAGEAFWSAIRTRSNVIW